MDTLESLITRLQKLIDVATGKLEANLTPRQIREYHEIMEELLSRYHLAAYMVGAGTEEISEKARAKIVEGVANQLAFLQGFITEIEDNDTFVMGWEARARMYGESISTPYWAGKTKMLPLPALPAEIVDGQPSTQCGSNCKCKIRVEVVNEKNGDYNAYWEYGDTLDHCQQCKERERSWNPLKIRNGVLLSE